MLQNSVKSGYCAVHSAVNDGWVYVLGAEHLSAVFRVLSSDHTRSTHAHTYTEKCEFKNRCTHSFNEGTCFLFFPKRKM